VTEQRPGLTGKCPVGSRCQTMPVALCGPQKAATGLAAHESPGHASSTEVTRAVRRAEVEEVEAYSSWGVRYSSPSTSKVLI
jgi:hypothetical protein